MRSTVTLAVDEFIPCNLSAGGGFSVIDSNRPWSDDTGCCLRDGEYYEANYRKPDDRTRRDRDSGTSLEQFFAQLFLGASEMFVKRRRANAE
jgi:hypothetical protein